MDQDELIPNSCLFNNATKERLRTTIFYLFKFSCGDTLFWNALIVFFRVDFNFLIVSKPTPRFRNQQNVKLDKEKEQNST